MSTSLPIELKVGQADQSPQHWAGLGSAKYSFTRGTMIRPVGEEHFGDPSRKPGLTIQTRGVVGLSSSEPFLLSLLRPRHDCRPSCFRSGSLARMFSSSHPSTVEASPNLVQTSRLSKRLFGLGFLGLSASVSCLQPQLASNHLQARLKP